MLEIAGICAGYSRVSVLQDISIHVGEGQFVSIVGPNGAGKSTLFKTISGVLKPTAGTIRFEGNDLLASDLEKREELGSAFILCDKSCFTE